MNKHETAQVLAYLSSAYPNAKVTKETAIVYHDLLQELNASEVMKSAKELVRESEWFPSPAQLLKSVARARGVMSPVAVTAWQEVCREVAHKGQMGIPEFSHATTQAVVASIGWRNICMSENADVLRSNFIKLYNDMATQADRITLSEVTESRSNALETSNAVPELNEG